MAKRGVAIRAIAPPEVPKQFGESFPQGGAPLVPVNESGLFYASPLWLGEFQRALIQGEIP